MIANAPATPCVIRQNMAQRLFTLEEVARHNKVDDLWIIVDGDVFDCSSFVDLHPGGKVTDTIVTAVVKDDSASLYTGLVSCECW